LKAMANDQKRDVKSFKDGEAAAQNPTVKKAAQIDEPVMSQHLQVLEQLAKSHTLPSPASKVRFAASAFRGDPGMAANCRFWIAAKHTAEIGLRVSLPCNRASGRPCTLSAEEIAPCRPGFRAP